MHGQDADGEFVAGAIGGKGTLLLGQSSWLPEGQGSGRLQEYRKRLKAGETPTVAELVSMEDPAVFYGEEKGTAQIPGLLPRRW